MAVAVIAGVATAGIGAYAATKKSSSGGGGGGGGGGTAPGTQANGGTGGNIFNAGTLFGSVTNGASAEGGGGGSAATATNGQPTLGAPAPTTQSAGGLGGLLSHYALEIILVLVGGALIFLGINHHRKN